MGAAMASLLMLSACGGSSKPFAELADIYIEMTDNVQPLGELMQKIYKTKDRAEAERLGEEYRALAQKVRVENEALEGKVDQARQNLVGKKIPCKIVGIEGASNEEAVVTEVKGPKNVAHIFLEAPFTGNADGLLKAHLCDGDTKLLEANARAIDGKIRINFYLSLKSAEAAAKATSILIEPSTLTTNNATAEAAEAEPAEPEPAYIGDDNSQAAEGAVQVDGVSVAKGMPLAETLRKLKNVSYEYNADSGIWASAGKVAIVISEDQLSPAGEAYINSLTSDIEPNIAFKPEYVKPGAKIEEVEAQ